MLRNRSFKPCGTVPLQRFMEERAVQVLPMKSWTGRKPLFQKRRQGGPEDQTSEEDVLAGHRPKLGNCPAAGGFGLTDCHRTCFLSELKTNYSNLSKVAHFVMTRVIPFHSFYNPILGGYVEDRKDSHAAVGASVLACRWSICARRTLHVSNDPFRHSDTDPVLLWAISAAQQA